VTSFIPAAINAAFNASTLLGISIATEFVTELMAVMESALLRVEEGVASS
jgi:hypothetical protein